MQSKPKMIFTVTAGRTGTTLLSELFSMFTNVTSWHEPRPNFVHAMRKSQSDAKLARKFLLNKKLPRIANINSEYYVETSHLFCKGFFEPLSEITQDLSLIFLRRNPSEIAYSLLSRDTIPGRTSLGINFLLHPNDPNVIPIESWENALTDYQLCYWYALEIERRQIEYGKKCAELGLNSFSLFTHDLTKFDVFNPNYG